VRKPLIIRDATYQDVVDAPELMVAELIDGDMYASPRPDGPHVETLSVLGMIIGSPTIAAAAVREDGGSSIGQRFT